MSTILLTGFAPFNGQSVNPSWEVAKKLDGSILFGSHRVHSVSLPTAFSSSATVLRESLDRLSPAIILCLGEAGGRAQMTPERVAINVIDARIPDNDGYQPTNEPISTDGPVAYWSTLPITEMVTAMKAKGIPAQVSDTAGTYVCNYLFYSLMHELATSQRLAIGGFMHVPYLSEQALEKSAPAWPLDFLVRGVETALQAIVENTKTKSH